ncbi:Tat pathway signal protein [Haloferax profundi]|nr:Tat pathway signal protein [Haloferax profundi]
MSALGVGLGIPAVSGSAAAWECPRTPGYWANHGDEKAWDTVGDTYGLTPETLLKPAKGDKAKIMAKHLVATKLNFQNRNDPDPCVDDPIEYGPFAGEDMNMRAVKRLAEDWMEASNYPDKQKRWHVTIDGEKVDGEPIKNTLDMFNNDPSKLGLYGCNCK